MTILDLNPEQRAAFERGEARAVEASTAGREQLAEQAEHKAAEPKAKYTVTVRPEKLKRCPVCDAPAIDPTTGQCTMPMCETYPSQQ